MDRFPIRLDPDYPSIRHRFINIATMIGPTNRSAPLWGPSENPRGPLCRRVRISLISLHFRRNIPKNTVRNTTRYYKMEQNSQNNLTARRTTRRLRGEGLRGRARAEFWKGARPITAAIRAVSWRNDNPPTKRIQLNEVRVKVRISLWLKFTRYF